MAANGPVQHLAARHEFGGNAYIVTFILDQVDAGF